MPLLGFCEERLDPDAALAHRFLECRGVVVAPNSIEILDMEGAAEHPCLLVRRALLLDGAGLVHRRLPAVDVPLTVLVDANKRSSSHPGHPIDLTAPPFLVSRAVRLGGATQVDRLLAAPVPRPSHPPLFHQAGSFVRPMRDVRCWRTFERFVGACDTPSPVRQVSTRRAVLRVEFFQGPDLDIGQLQVEQTSPELY
jgi:hypothetical protein